MSAGNTKIPLENLVDGYLSEAKNIKGGFATYQTIAERDAVLSTPQRTAVVAGSICYVTATDKTYKYNGSTWQEYDIGGTAAWGSIAGTLSNQIDLQNALDSKYVKPAPGIPSTDMTSDVQASLAKADSALQSAPVASVAGKTGVVTLDKTDVGLGNVGNFKSVSTGANQGLTNTEKSNARANIGAADADVSSATVGQFYRVVEDAQHNKYAAWQTVPDWDGSVT